MVVELHGGDAGVVGRNELLYLRAEFLLLLGETIRNILRERVGDALIEERLLAFE